MSSAPTEYERQEQKQRAQAWYAVVGFGVLVAGVAVILSWMPDNPFSRPSETPNTTRLNASALTCRVSDVALVQEWRGSFHMTNTEALLAYADRARSRRFSPDGWTADGAADAGTGCVVVFHAREGRAAKDARWTVSDDRTTVTPDNAFARELAAMLPSRRR